MNLERIPSTKLDTSIANQIIVERMKVFGKAIGSWFCNKCKHQMDSFLYNFEHHISENCPKCDGVMVEDETKREVQKTINMIDRSREKNWDKGLSPAQQASVLLGESDPY